MGLLQDILAKKAEESRALKGVRPAARGSIAERRDVVQALRRTGTDPLRLIAEIKFRSPSAGVLSRALDVTARARAYEQGGVAMISVLTDPTWFDGSIDHLYAAREAVAIPVLCKDFIIDDAQIEHARASGADAVLLIVRCLPAPGQLERLVDAARSRDVEPFVEVVDERELDRALRAGAHVIGVNARDLDTLKMDAERAERVVASIPEDHIAVHLSGLRTSSDAARIAGSRASAALIGEALMRCDDPRELLDELVQGAKSQIATAVEHPRPRGPT